MADQSLSAVMGEETNDVSKRRRCFKPQGRFRALLAASKTLPVERLLRPLSNPQAG